MTESELHSIPCPICAGSVEPPKEEKETVRCVYCGAWLSDEKTDKKLIADLLISGSEAFKIAEKMRQLPKHIIQCPKCHATDDEQKVMFDNTISKFISAGGSTEHIELTCRYCNNSWWEVRNITTLFWDMFEDMGTYAEYWDKKKQAELVINEK